MAEKFKSADEVLIRIGVSIPCSGGKDGLDMPPLPES
jgi:hypothetical protein